MKKIIFGIALVMGAIGFAAFFPSSPAINKAQLGEMLFNEKMLSRDSSVSCSSCHLPSNAFADTLPFSIGIGGKLTSRNTPSVLNMKNRPYYFWDGRALSLEDQALMPISNPDEMGLPVHEAVKRLNESEKYKRAFFKVFEQLPSEQNLASAISAYQQTLETVDSKFDDWSNGISELSAAEERGRLLFIGDKAKCFNCHFMEDFTDDSFKNIGIYNGKEFNDRGRYNITGDSSDLGKFKTPGLRNIELTSPYMHNGMFNTLDQVLAYYNTPGHFIDDAININPDLARPLGLTPAEKKDIIAFLETLSDRSHQKKGTKKN